PSENKGDAAEPQTRPKRMGPSREKLRNRNSIRKKIYTRVCKNAQRAKSFLYLEEVANREVKDKFLAGPINKLAMKVKLSTLEEKRTRESFHRALGTRITDGINKDNGKKVSNEPTNMYIISTSNSKCRNVLKKQEGEKASMSVLESLNESQSRTRIVSNRSNLKKRTTRQKPEIQVVVVVEQNQETK
ncbi:8257_t:CDS:2, partial [Gigaspora rosea]